MWFSARTAAMLARPECKPLPREEEERLIALAQRGDVRARNRVVMSHARLAAEKVVKALRRYALDADEALADDMLHTTLFGTERAGGIARALTKFEPGRGVRFSTLLQQWVQGEIETVLAARAQVGPPRRTRARRARIRSIALKLKAGNASEASRETLVHAVARQGDGGRKVVERALAPDEVLVPIQTWLTDRSVRPPITPAELIEQTSPADSIDRDRLTAALARLSKQEAHVVCALYLEERTPAEVAKMLGVTAKAVREIAKESLAKLRAELAEVAL